MDKSSSIFSRRRFIKTAGAALPCIAVWGKAAADAPSRPNIVFLLTDDQRWDALGCMGNSIIQTPNLDQLAAEGTLFTHNFCTTSICMSSRASLFTGLYTRCHGIDDFSLPLPPERFAYTYPALLRKAGYRTGFIGKWGLGGKLPAEEFDYFEGFEGQGKYFHEIDGKQVHLTKILGDKALDFIKGCSNDKLFCLSVSFKAPHVQDEDHRQFLYEPDLEELYQKDQIPLPKTADDKFFQEQSEFVQKSEGRIRWDKRFATPEMRQTSVKGYYRLVTGVDRVLGKLRAALQEAGLSDNTVIVFTSDNGFYLGEHGLAGKWLMHEESIRTPLIIFDPRQDAEQRGRKISAMTLNIDAAPTLLDLAGVEIPSFLQGRSLLPLLRNEKMDWRQEWFYEHFFGYQGKIPRTVGIRTDRWKYVRYIDPDPAVEEFYDIQDDPLEENNLIAVSEYQPLIGAMRDRVQAWEKQLQNWKLDPSYHWGDPL
ncbi:MAG: sulfatase [Candidatus Omnitrophota bacterium]